MKPATAPDLEIQRYKGYSYAYPHKTAYRALDPPVPLKQVWESESLDALFGYLHVPFCNSRCGFCNLLTTARPPAPMVDEYLDSVERQIEAIHQSLPGATFAQFAIGGGTPTYLTAPQLLRMFDLLKRIGIDPQRIPGSVETSPSTATPERLDVLREAGVTRISIGVQTFCDQEVRLLGRQQTRAAVDEAIERILDKRFPCMNIDLIYGGDGQTVMSWLDSVQQTIDIGPEEIYLYPLYIRPITSLWRREENWDDVRLAAYRAGRDLLLENGYTQVSMRMFRRTDTTSYSDPEYCCQKDGMIGLGCGARSYTRTLHYATEYAVSHAGVRDIIEAFIASDTSDFASVSHGIHLDRQEQIRRFAIKSLLRIPGIDHRLYRNTFESDVLDDLPQLHILLEEGLAEMQDEIFGLTQAGLELSDAIGPWLYSAKINTLVKEHKWR